MKKFLTTSTEADQLRELHSRLAKRGFESETLNMRLAFNEQAVILNYVKAVHGKERVFPHFLPTQASGRWSVTNPPLTNWTPDIRDMIVPDPGFVWVGWDLSAIEGKIVAAFSHDKDDLAAFNNDWDIHSMTAVKMIGWENEEVRRTYAETVPYVQKDILRSAIMDKTGEVLFKTLLQEAGRGERPRTILEGWESRLRAPRRTGLEAWIGAGCTSQKWEHPGQQARELGDNDERRAWTLAFSAWVLCGGPPPAWKGKDDIRRITAKVRYCLLYGRDWTAVNGSKYEKDMVKLGYRREVLQNAAKAFLRSKPNLLACKRKYWELCAKTGEARTIFGRRRKLFGDYWMKAKEGWNHMVQGSVTDMVNREMIDLHEHSKGAWTLVYPSHDAAKFSIPERLVAPEHKAETVALFRRVVERGWEIDGEKITSSATWHIYYSDGRVEHL